MTERLTIAAVVFMAAAIALGVLVSPRAPGALDHAAEALRGQAVGAALTLTEIGRGWPILAISAVALALAALVRASLLPVVAVIVAQTVSQGVDALLKLGFHRIRPMQFAGLHEPDFSYPSGHATTAVVFFAGLAILAWWGPLPRPLAIPLAAAGLIATVGIPWSRLALGAHYATDVIGGLLVGAAWLCLALAAIGRWSPTLSR